MCVCVLCVCRMPELNWQCWDFIFRGKKKIQKTAVRELTADIECILCVSVRMCVSVYNVNMPKARKTGKRESNRMSKFTALSLSSSSSFFFSTSSHSQNLLYDFLLVFVFCFQFEWMFEGFLTLRLWHQFGYHIKTSTKKNSY